MTAIALEKNVSEKRDKRAKSIASMGLVNREGDCFKVSTPSLRGRQSIYDVRRDETGKIRCNCLEFEEGFAVDAGFRCEHILAVKYALVAKNTEPATKQTDKTVSNVKDNTESSAMSAPGEQKTDDIPAEVSDLGQTETVEADEHQLENAQGENNMTQENLQPMPFVTAEENEFEATIDDTTD